jgi:hypothetical protein
MAFLPSPAGLAAVYTYAECSALLGLGGLGMIEAVSICAVTSDDRAHSILIALLIALGIS